MDEDLIDHDLKKEGGRESQDLKEEGGDEDFADDPAIAINRSSEPAQVEDIRQAAERRAASHEDDSSRPEFVELFPFHGARFALYGAVNDELVVHEPAGDEESPVDT